jgi:hypothetical protein
MRRINIFIALLLCALFSKAEISAVFKWSQPSILTPAYSAPTSADRYGEYIGNVEFTDNGVTIKIVDNSVKELSQSARFVYSYITQVVEMRAYQNSDIVITAPEGMDVVKVVFDGAKVDANYLTSYDETGTFSDGTWTAGQAANVAKFYVDDTINCTITTVYCAEHNSVSDITVDNAQSPEVWYTIFGQRLENKPTAVGVYVKQKEKETTKILIR